MKPILFNTESVKAILDGRKSVTRRVVKPQPTWDGTMWRVGDNGCGWGKSIKTIRFDRDHTMSGLKMPCRRGDIMYVRETWAKQFGIYWHKAGVKNHPLVSVHGVIPPEKWRPSIHMPKEAARLFLRVTDVRVERLQDIESGQAVAEGAVKRPNYTKRGDLVLRNRYRKEFAKLWDSNIKKADLPHYGWTANPWVWVIKFERISKEEALIDMDAV